MKDILKTSRNLLKNKSLFKIAFVITTFFFSVHIAQYLSYVAIVLIILWGIGLLIKGVAAKEVYFNKILIAFLAAGLISHIVNIFFGDASLFGTAVGMVLLLITAQFMLLFFSSKNDDIKNIRLEVYYISKIIFWCTTVINIIGLILLFVFKDTLGERIIIYDNRFVGAYTNPNMAAFNCFLCIVFGLFIANRTFCQKINKKPIKMWVYIVCATLALFVLIITDSKGSLLALMAFLCAMLLLIAYKIFKNKNFKNNVFKLLVVLVLLCSAPFMNSVFSPVLSYAVSHSNVETSVKNDNKKVEKNQSAKKNDKITFEHEKGKKDGSGRIGLYKKSFEFFTKKPILGWGCGNMLLKGEATTNNTIDNVKIDFGTKLFEAHNGYLTLLSTSGVIGFLIFAVFVLLVFFALFKNALYEVRKKILGEKAFVFAIACAFFAYAFVEPSLVYYPALVVAILWIILGYGFKLFAENNDFSEKVTKFYNKFIGFDYIKEDVKEDEISE